MKKRLIIAAAITAAALPSCAPSVPKTVALKMLSTHEGKLPTAVAVRKIDKRLVSKSDATKMVTMVTPGKHTIECEFAQLANADPKLMVCSWKPIVLDVELQPGTTYQVETGTLRFIRQPQINLAEITPGYEASVCEDVAGSPKLVVVK